MENWQKQRERTALLHKFDRNVRVALRDPDFTKGTPFPVREVRLFSSYRFGAVLINAGFQNSRLLDTLTSRDYANVQQLIPWTVGGVLPKPAAMVDNGFVHFEAPWATQDLHERGIDEDNLVDFFDLYDMPERPTDGESYLAGLNAQGGIVIMGFSDDMPHHLFTGTTGSGKTNGMAAAVIGLGRGVKSRIIVFDAKSENNQTWLWLNGHPNLVMPVCNTTESILQGAGWVIQEIDRRLQMPRDDLAREGRLIVVWDEFQDMIAGRYSKLFSEFMRRVVVKGREAKVHMLAGTQYSKAEAFSQDAGSTGGTAIRSAFAGLVVFNLVDAVQRRLVLGETSTLPAERLHGMGDCFAVAKRQDVTVRMQFVKADQQSMNHAKDRYLGKREDRMYKPLTDYPTDCDLGYVLGGADTMESKRGRKREPFRADHLGVAIAAIEADPEIARDPLNDTLRDKTGQGIASSNIGQLVTYATDTLRWYKLAQKEAQDEG